MILAKLGIEKLLRAALVAFVLFNAIGPSTVVNAQDVPTESNDELESKNSQSPINNGKKTGNTNEALQTSEQPIISSYFTGTDIDGWSINAGVLQNFGQNGSDGNGDGYIQTNSPADGITSYYIAPNKFLGDWRNYTKLRFKMISSGGDWYTTGFGMHGDIYIVNGGKTA